MMGPEHERKQQIDEGADQGPVGCGDDWGGAALAGEDGERREYAVRLKERIACSGLALNVRGSGGRPSEGDEAGAEQRKGLRVRRRGAMAPRRAAAMGTEWTERKGGEKTEGAEKDSHGRRKRQQKRGEWRGEARRREEKRVRGALRRGEAHTQRSICDQTAQVRAKHGKEI